jgi:hypothetical protein
MNELLTDEQIDELFKLHATVGSLDMGFARAGRVIMAKR